MSAIVVHDPRAESLARPGESLERLASGAAWSEGPVWMHEDGSVLWSDIPANRMLRWHPRDGTSVWRHEVEFTNGHTREADGALLHCSHGQRAIVRTRFKAGLAEATDEVLASHYQGRRLNSPTDVVVKRDGTIWFTDPPYGIVSNHEGHQAESELGDNYVFRFDPDSNTLDVVSTFVEEPNGLAFSPDESMLYIADTGASHADGGPRHIRRFAVAGDGRRLGDGSLFAECTSGMFDGFRLDTQGRIWTSAADGVHVYDPDGSLIGKILLPERVANVCFGGPKRNRLFICATSSLYAITVNARGV